jgi:hypothetical protein
MYAIPSILLNETKRRIHIRQVGGHEFSASRLTRYSSLEISGLFLFLKSSNLLFVALFE